MGRRGPMIWRYVRMPKSGSTSIAECLTAHGNPEPEGHWPASKVRAEHPPCLVFGSIRGRFSWYKSWYNHVYRAGQGNERTVSVLRHYGQGDQGWPAVLYGLTHLDEVGLWMDPHTAAGGDHLFNPAGMLYFGSIGLHAKPCAGFYTQAVWWFFREHWRTTNGWPIAGPWCVDALIDLDQVDAGLSELSGQIVHVERRNVAPPLELEDTPELRGWVDVADSRVRTGEAVLWVGGDR